MEVVDYGIKKKQKKSGLHRTVLINPPYVIFFKKNI